MLRSVSLYSLYIKHLYSFIVWLIGGHCCKQAMSSWFVPRGRVENHAKDTWRRSSSPI